MCHARDKTKVFGLPQSLGGDAALGTENNAWRGTPCLMRTGGSGRAGCHRPARQCHVAAKHSGLPIGDVKAALRETHHSTRTLQTGRLGRDLHIVASQCQTALHAGFIECRQRQTQLQTQVCIAGAGRQGQRLTGHMTHGRALHERQHVGERAVRLGTDDHGGGVQQIGYLAFSRRDLQAGCVRCARNSRWSGQLALDAFDLQHQPVNQKLARQLGEFRPGQGVCWRDAAGNIGQGHIGQVGRYPEVTLLCVGKGQVMQIPLDVELDARCRALHQRVTDVVAHPLQHDFGQVTVDAGALQAAHAALQIEHARQAGAASGRVGDAGVPLELCFPLRIGVAELQVGHLHRQALTLNLPLRSARQLCKRYQRILEQARQFDGTVAHHKVRFAARLGQVEINCGIAHSGPTGAS